MAQIDGVVITPLRKIPDERGCIFHMLKKTDETFTEFGEIYFSTVNPQAIKAWHIHKEMELNYSVVNGMIKLVLYDDRPNSPTKGTVQEIFMGDQNYVLVKIPPMVWNGFKGISKTASLVANCSTLPHDPKEIDRKDPFSKEIPYTWDIKHG